MKGAKSFMGIPRTPLLSVWIYALTQAHPVTTTDAPTLANLSRNFNGMDDSGKLAVICYLLAKLAGGPTDPASLFNSGKQFMGLSNEAKLAVIAYLSCQFA